MSMTLEQIRLFIRENIGTELTLYGFKEENELDFKHEEKGAEQFIGFICNERKDRSFAITFGVRVRFPSIENLLNRGQSDANNHGTFGGLVHLLHSDQKYFEWIIERESELAEIAKEIMEQIKQYAFPFLQRFSDLRNIESQISIDDPKGWLTLTSEERVMLLAAIQWSKGMRHQSLVLLENAIQERENQPAKYSTELQKMAKYLRSLSRQPKI